MAEAFIPRQPCHVPACDRYAEWTIGDDPEESLKVGPTPDDARRAGLLTVVCSAHIGEAVVMHWITYHEPEIVVSPL